jgi:sugar phosphate isomerase/epimerase
VNAGINLFSLRKLLGSEEGFLSTLRALANMGYSYLQISGAPWNAALFAKGSKEYGLPVYLTHAPMDRILNDTDALMKEHELFGCGNIGLGMMPVETVIDESACKACIERLNGAAERMKRNGFTFFYHHHHFEFFRHNGETVFEYMLKNAPSINFTADSYWLQYGGVTPESYFKKLRGRTACVHLKDYRIVCEQSDTGARLKPAFAPVGCGSLDFAAIVKAAKKAGAKYFFVEQDDACDYPDPLAQAEKSIRYIKENL